MQLEQGDASKKVSRRGFVSAVRCPTCINSGLSRAAFGGSSIWRSAFGRATIDGVADGMRGAKAASGLLQGCSGARYRLFRRVSVAAADLLFCCTLGLASFFSRKATRERKRVSTSAIHAHSLMQPLNNPCLVKMPLAGLLCYTEGPERQYRTVRTFTV